MTATNRVPKIGELCKVHYVTRNKYDYYIYLGFTITPLGSQAIALYSLIDKEHKTMERGYFVDHMELA